MTTSRDDQFAVELTELVLRYGTASGATNGGRGMYLLTVFVALVRAEKIAAGVDKNLEMEDVLQAVKICLENMIRKGILK